MSRKIKIRTYEGADVCRGLELENGMQVLLIQRDNVRKFTAALNVPIGSYDEPYKMHGLAHLLEHIIARRLIHTGENYFARILDQCGGNANATTHNDYTIYSISAPFRQLCDPSVHFLKLFAELIFKPIDEDKDIIKEEVEAVDSEYMIKSTTDELRINELQYAYWNTFLLDKMFKPGNKNTFLRTSKGIPIDLMAELKQFHEQFYSANIMSLCIVAADSLDILQTLVEQSFSDKPNVRITPQLLETNNIRQELTKYRTSWFIVPTLPNKILQIYFPLLFDYRNYIRKPADYIRIMLNDRRQGSLLAVLKNRHWCISIDCTNEYLKFGKYTICLTLTLTQQGLDHIDDIITLIFQYLRLLREEKRNNYYKIFRKNFWYLYSSSSCLQLAKYIKAYSLPNVLMYSDLSYCKFYANEVDSIIEKSINPELLLYCIAAKEIECITNAITPWNQTKYATHEILPNKISQWSRIINATNTNEIEINRDLRPPRKNNNFEWNFVLQNRTTYERLPQLPRKPISVYDSNISKIWCRRKQDRQFEIYFQFYCRRGEPKDYNLNEIFVYLIQDYISEYTYSVELVSIEIQLKSNVYGISLCIKNRQYATQLSNIVSEIISKMLNVPVNKDRFEMLKEQYITFLKEKISAASEEQATHLLETFLTQGISYDKLLDNMAISVTDMSEYIEDFRNNIYIKCLICTLTREEVNSIVDQLHANFQSLTKTSYEELEKPHAQILERGFYKLIERNNFSHKSSCTKIYYQVEWRILPEERIQRSAFLQIIKSILQQKCFEYLRNNLKLGYTAKAQVKHMYDSCGLVITVVGHKKKPADVENLINAFMKDAMHRIYLMENELFEKYKRSTIYFREGVGTQIVNFCDSNRYWQEIISEDYMYSRVRQEIKCMRSATQEQISHLFKMMINTDSQRKLSIHILSKQHECQIESNIRDK